MQGLGCRCVGSITQSPFSAEQHTYTASSFCHYFKITHKPWAACTAQRSAAARTSVEEEDDSSLSRGHDHVDGVALEVAPDVGVAGVVVPGQLPVLHRRLIEFLHTDLNVIQSPIKQPAPAHPFNLTDILKPRLPKQACHAIETAHRGCPRLIRVVMCPRAGRQGQQLRLHAAS